VESIVAAIIGSSAGLILAVIGVAYRIGGRLGEIRVELRAAREERSKIKGEVDGLSKGMGKVVENQATMLERLADCGERINRLERVWNSKGAG
jgi:hypothetical protein